MNSTCKIISLMLILVLTGFSQNDRKFLQLIHLETDQYFSRSDSRIAIWNAPGDWEKTERSAVAELRVKADNIIIQRGLSIYRYQADRQAITAYDKKLNELESTTLNALQIQGNISTFGVSNWGDFWFITSDGNGIIIPAHGGPVTPFEWAQDDPPEVMVAFPRTMAVITATHIIIYDLFGNKLTAFPKPADAADYVGFTRDTMIFRSQTQNSLIAVGNRPGIQLRFSLPDRKAVVISDAKTNSVSVWTPGAGRSILTPIQAPK